MGKTSGCFKDSAVWPFFILHLLETTYQVEDQCVKTAHALGGQTLVVITLSRVDVRLSSAGDLTDYSLRPEAAYHRCPARDRVDLNAEHGFRLATGGQGLEFGPSTGGI
ncbi:unnamed protein product [Soboliphyme baturini]|uniref:Secreted protein n=1 Tax=Soboliphyme baturini TaxID=241478 RepID=A0A183ISC3_9BILA|nr:unnamed protein product [Soboliphyme baturini]